MSSTRVYGQGPSAGDSKTSRSYIPQKFHPYPVRWQSLLPGIPEPIKRLESDAGWELCLISKTGNRIDDETNAVNLYDTGIRCAPPPGFYLEVVATQDLYKHGYCLPSGGVQYQPEEWEEIVVPLVKMNDGPDLEVPFNGVRIIPKRVEHCHLVKVVDVDTSDVIGDIGVPGGSSRQPTGGQYRSNDQYNSRPPAQSQQPPQHRGRAALKTNHMW